MYIYIYIYIIKPHKDTHQKNNNLDHKFFFGNHFRSQIESNSSHVIAHM